MAYLVHNGKYVLHNGHYVVTGAGSPPPVTSYNVYFGMMNDPGDRTAGKGFYGTAYIRKGDGTVATDANTGNPVRIDPPDETFVVTDTIWALTKDVSYYADYTGITSKGGLTMTISVTDAADKVSRTSDPFILDKNKSVSGYFT